MYDDDDDIEEPRAERLIIPVSVRRGLSTRYVESKKCCRHRLRLEKI